MKREKKIKPRDVAIITGNPNDQIIVNPEEAPKKIQTESKAAIKQLKEKLQAPEFQYMTPTERSSVDSKNVDRQVKHIKKVVSKISTQQVSEEELNQVFSSINEAGRLASLASAPIRAAGNIGRAAALGATGAWVMSHPETAAVAVAAGAHLLAHKMSRFGKYTPKRPDPKQKAAAKTKDPARPQANTAPQQPVQQSQPAATPQPQAQPQAQPRQQKIRSPKAQNPSTKNPYPSLNPNLSTPPPGANVVSVPPSWTPPKPGPQPSYSQSSAPYIPNVPPTPKGRPQGGGKIPGQVSQTPNAIRKRQQRAAARNVVSHREWDYDTYLSEKAEHSLYKKSDKSGIDFEILEQVYQRGMDSWNKESDRPIHEFAMNRVNSFIAKGKNYHEEDSDLQEKTVMVLGKRKQRLGDKANKNYLRKMSHRKNIHHIIHHHENEYERLVRHVKEKQRKVRQSFNEDINESFVIDRPSGIGAMFTAADLGMKIQGGFALHPSVMEEGGAGDIGTDKLKNKYTKDTPGQLSRLIRKKANIQC